jgi:hypothetical protein
VLTKNEWRRSFDGEYGTFALAPLGGNGADSATLVLDYVEITIRYQVDGRLTPTRDAGP